MKKLDKCPACGFNTIYCGEILFMIDYNFRMHSHLGRIPALCNAPMCGQKLWVNFKTGLIIKRNVIKEIDDDF